MPPQCSGSSAFSQRAAALLFALAIGCAGPGTVAQEARSAPPPTPAAVAPASGPFAALYEAVVAEIVIRFFDEALLRRIDWRRMAEERRAAIVAAPDQAAAVARINALLAELKTSHTQLFTPEEIEFYILADVFSRTDLVPELWGAPVVVAGIGAFMGRLEERTFVDAILEGSPAETAGLKVGDEIVAVDGAPYTPVAAFRRKEGGSVTVSVRRLRDGPLSEIKVPVVLMQPREAFSKATRNSVRVIERAGRRYGYVHLWAIRDDDLLVQALSTIDPTRRDFRNARGERTVTLPSKEIRPLDGLIIDNRVKVGGTTSTASHFTRVLRADDGYRLSVSGRSATAARTPPPPPPQSVPMAMLIDQRSRSASELFAYGFRRERLGPLIGARTAGAVSAGSASPMPGGLLLYVAVQGLAVDGEVLEGVGVAPDIAVARVLPYANGADPALDAAIEHLSRR